jgi:4-aminobutyrate aminotransferase-like enzyme
MKRSRIQERFLARDGPGELQIAHTGGRFVFDANGIDLEEEDYASELHEKCHRAGLVFSHESGSILLLLPALNMERAVAERGLDILERSV